MGKIEIVTAFFTADQETQELVIKLLRMDAEEQREVIRKWNNGSPEELRRILRGRKN